MKQITAPVISSSEVTPGIFMLWIEEPEIAADVRPGQFVTVRCGQGFQPLLRRPLSVHRVENGKLALLFAVVGEGTAWLCQRKAGDTLDIFGPLGNGFAIPADLSKILLVAGGIGIAPLVTLAEQAVSRGITVKLLQGAASGSRLHPLAINGAEVLQVTENGSVGTKGKVTDFLPSLAPWAEGIFACGPIPMYRAMAAKGVILRDKPVQVLLEQVMGCGVGACRGCAIATHHGIRMVCSDGPVFDLQEIIWDEVVCPGLSRIK